MNAVIAIDSFKGSLSSISAGNAVKEAIKRVYTDAHVEICPLADGGEGTVEAVTSAMGGELCEAVVTGPLGESTRAVYGIIPRSRTAVIEMSAAAGITLVPEDKRDPLRTTTYGVGELLLHAIREKGCRNFIIGIGGSATNDGGVGMLTSLGFEFLDKDGNPIAMGAEGLSDLYEIRTDKAARELKECSFTVACDVKNPLCGDNGCSAVYGPQKGATPESIKLMDAWLSGYARLTAELLGKDLSNSEGAGAAGGMGFALISYLGATLRSGIDTVIDASGLEEKIKSADIVVTGEGRLDGQSVMGKAPIGVAARAKKYGKTVIAFCGAAARDASECNKQGIDAFFPILRAPCSLADAMDEKNAYENLCNTAEQVFRVIKEFQYREKN
ncbi:MAG: glycerate kinase [Ruminococcaceae bacterium]|nr:glycerate kinase [Oscillospiraceae bacterium]